MANPFEKKTWQNRLSEYPTRRQLVDVSTGNTQTVDVTRSEGQVYNTGDGFTQANMNDLEQRIYDAFEDFDGIGALSHNVPRVVPKDITQYYNDGTLWNRIKGQNGYTPYEDIFVGDYFKISRPITANDSEIESQVTGAEWVSVAYVDPQPYINNNARHSYLLLVPGRPDVPISNNNRITYGVQYACHFGKCKSSINQGDNYCYYSSRIASIIGNTVSEGDTSSDATITQQLYAEFGNHLATLPSPSLTVGSFPTGNIVTYELFTGATRYGKFPSADSLMAICPSEFEILGFPCLSNNTGDLYGFGHIPIFNFYSPVNLQAATRTAPVNNKNLEQFVFNDGTPLLPQDNTSIEYYVIPLFAIA